ncbi:MAG: hypothetical protein LBT01_03365 [Spirochaetaceae bacterium]|jgi:hypothetical protein|nr:hypothetical protein [Spirochaetaceae bacterium]
MSTLHIIGIGGTGHKLITACIHLAACGAFKGKGTNDINLIRMITIDADDSNGNLSHAKQVAASYHKFYSVLGQSQTLGLVEIQPLTSVRLYQNDKKSINETFNIAQYRDTDTDKFVHFLYTKEEIETQFDQGFYGHTSIGTLIVKNILKQDENWQGFLSGIYENDFVFVLGSIFGGTGASAIPVVLDELKERQKEDAIKYAALILTPYFNTIGDIKEEGVLQPDSKNFQVKAKAALYYYEKEKQNENADAIYIIGEPKENFSNEAASRGASDQLNKAHMVELFAASAIIDFIKYANDRPKQKIITAERETLNGEYYYTWNMLHKIDALLPEKIKKLIKAAIFYNKVLYRDLINNDEKSGTWIGNYNKELLSRIDDDQNLLYENIYAYFTKLIRWFYDLHKRNSAEIDQNSGRPKWSDDKRAKLFHAEYLALFDESSVQGSDIKDFEKLVYNDENPKKSEKIYVQICSAKGAGFIPLFDALDAAITSKKRGLFDPKPEKIPENFTIVPYLSKENNASFTRQNADTNQLWSYSESSLLSKIADGLPFVLGDEFTKDDISIPSPWSIFISNELTLTEKKFAGLNKTSYNQWCGFLALLALRKLRRYENDGLELKQLSLDDGEFVKTVGDTCIPYSFIFDNRQWTTCWNISLDGETIGFLAVNTIVCPAYSFSAKTKTKLHQMAPSIVNENGEFLSPDNYFADQSQRVNRDARYALSIFLSELKRIIRTEAATNEKPIINSLQHLIEKFIESLGRTSSNPDISIPNYQPPTDIRDLFDKLDIQSNAIIELPFRLTGTKKNAVLIGLNVCGIGSSTPQAASIFITPNYKYNQINADSIQQLSGNDKDGYLLLYDIELLCDTMLIIKKDDTSVFHTLSNNNSSLPGIDVIWPVNERLLELYDAAQINGMLGISKNDDTFTVSLDLKLASGKTHTVTKSYKIKSGDSNAEDADNSGFCYTFDRENLPLWAVWPYSEILNTEGKNTWKRYNCYCAELKQTGSLKVMEIDPVFPSGDKISNQDDEKRLSIISTGQRDIYYKRYKTLPSAFKFKLKYDANIPAVYRGLVFLEQAKQYQAANVEWNIGLDFGTTSTTVFYTTNSADSALEFLQLLTEYTWKEGNPNPQETKKIENDMVVVCNSGGRDLQDLSYYFIDDKCLKQKGYITAYELLDTTGGSAEDTVFKSGRIFWHNERNLKIVNATEGRRDNLQTNIKWDENRDYIGKFLNQLLTQIVYNAASKGVRKINCFFSYPTAFSFREKGLFRDTLERLVEGIEEDTGVEITFKPENLITESIAAAFYFRKDSRHRLFLCVDIGGGTSDVSIWTPDVNLFQTSIRFASRNMFIAPLERLLKRKSVMDVVRSPDVADGIHTMLEYGGGDTPNSKDKIKFFIETVLFEYYDKFKQRLDSLKGEDELCYKNFRYCVFIAYSALCYYLANIIVSLLKVGKIDNDVTDLVFGLSGKGSKLTDWIKEICPKIYEEIQSFILEKTGVSIKFRPQFSADSAKTETAKGLICNLVNGKQKESGEGAEPMMYLGSSIELAKGSDTPRCYSKADFVNVYTDELIKNPVELKVSIDRELADFGEFLDFFNRLAEKTRGEMPEISIDWYQKNKKSLWNQIEKVFNDILKDKRFEPPFIVIIKEFLQFYTEEYLYENK